jgi:sigma-B regulation protein RsbU (phosphoserine phosphatase)
MLDLERRRRLLVLGAIGVVVLAAGVAAALLRLPEWRNRGVPDQAFFGARLQQAAAHVGLELETVPRAELQSKSWLRDSNLQGDRETAYNILGPKAADWLAREGRGPYVVVAARSHWAAKRRETGELRVLFSTRGVPIAAMWVPDNLLSAKSKQNADDHTSLRGALLKMFVPAGTHLPEREVNFLTSTVYVSPLPGSAPPETIISTSIEGMAFPLVQRVVGSPEYWRQRMESVTLASILASQLQQSVVRGIFNLSLFVLFVLLLARRRIELAKGATLGVISIALSLAGPIQSSSTWIQLGESLVGVVGKGVALFVLWSSAESWLRSTIPGFRTSLDRLRAGRLGPAGGRALLAGWSIGAAVAGLWLVALAAATLVPGVAPIEGSIRLPMFNATPSPIDEGVLHTGYVLIAICAALRLPLIRRVRGSGIAMAGLVIATRVPVTSFWFALVIGLVVAAVLIRAYAGYGLTALLSAAVTSTVLPAALFSLMHASWLTPSATLLSAVAVAPLLFGLIGIRRPDEVEEGPLPLPAFVRRLEEENRLKYEMDLLARMQLGLLPKETPRMEGWEIAARSILATEAGGDLYDFVHDTEGRLWIAAGDVSGHGYSCAIAQAMTKAGLASLVEADRTPAIVLTRLDRVLRGSGASRTFTSLALLRLDPATGDALVSNAGHPYPWIVTRSGDATELELPSLPLGQGPSRTYADVPLTLDPGSVLLLSSDGLFEGADAAGKPYGFERIRQILGKVHRRPAEAILTAIVEDWRLHVGAGAPADDTTIVVVKRG